MIPCPFCGDAPECRTCRCGSFATDVSDRRGLLEVYLHGPMDSDMRLFAFGVADGTVDIGWVGEDGESRPVDPGEVSDLVGRLLAASVLGS